VLALSPVSVYDVPVGDVIRLYVPVLDVARYTSYDVAPLTAGQLTVSALVVAEPTDGALGAEGGAAFLRIA
jgi:hypothetical protein